MPFERDPNEIGCLWIKQSAKGDYFTGTVNGEPVVVFLNTKKAPGSKAPDYRILKPKPKDAPAPSADHDDISF